MDKSAIERIVELGAPNILNENGFIYTDKALTVVKTPLVQTVKFCTLNGLIAALKAEYEKFSSPFLVNIHSYDGVRVLSTIKNSDRSREEPYQAKAELPEITFDRFTTSESMLIQLKSKFVQTRELLELVQLLGTIVDENSIKLMDDGFSQSVTVKKGIALKDNRVVNSRIKLSPYRTFLDVPQPESEYILRLQEGGGVALFEADGGAWKLQARKNIAAKLSVDLEELITTNTVIIVE